MRRRRQARRARPHPDLPVGRRLHGQHRARSSTRSTSSCPPTAASSCCSTSTGRPVRSAAAPQLRDRAGAPAAGAAAAFRTTVITNEAPAAARSSSASPRPARPRADAPLDLTYPRDVFSLSHLALPFPLNDSLYGMTPTTRRLRRQPRRDRGARRARYAGRLARLAAADVVEPVLPVHDRADRRRPGQGTRAGPLTSRHRGRDLPARLGGGCGGARKTAILHRSIPAPMPAARPSASSCARGAAGHPGPCADRDIDRSRPAPNRSRSVPWCSARLRSPCEARNPPRRPPLARPRARRRPNPGRAHRPGPAGRRRARRVHLGRARPPAGGAVARLRRDLRNVRRRDERRGDGRRARPGGPDGARAALEAFWRRVSDAARLQPVPARSARCPDRQLDARLLAGVRRDGPGGPRALALRLEPDGLNPLRQILLDSVDFERLRAGADRAVHHRHQRAHRPGPRLPQRRPHCRRAAGLGLPADDVPGGRDRRRALLGRRLLRQSVDVAADPRVLGVRHHPGPDQPDRAAGHAARRRARSTTG